MRKKSSYLREKADKKLRWRNRIFLTLIAVMFMVVLYDSFTHNTPFYYICFLFLGLMIGLLISITDRVKHNVTDGAFTVESGPISIIFTLLLLALRFLWGRQLLETAHVVWTTDALYLVFIGIYWSRWKSIVIQMDEIVYGWLSSKKN